MKKLWIIIALLAIVLTGCTAQEEDVVRNQTDYRIDFTRLSSI